MTSKMLRVMAMGVLVPFSTVTLAMPAVQATAVISTDEAIAQSRAAALSGERERVQAFLAREDVAHQLARLGVDPAAAQARVDALTDAEVAQLDHHIEQLPAGGSSVLGALVFIFVLLLVTDILGFTKVFPFTRSMR
ncbi:MAG TPA: PA2779 family protein [Candidatus Acidoferrales bacterium]|nr:PA2779 family protein [Candidatus Acidoferrales bacterium]